MPDKSVESKNAEERNKDYFAEEISSIGMSLRPSGSASSGEWKIGLNKATDYIKTDYKKKKNAH